MKRDIPPLNQLRALEAAIRHESFTKASEELHVTQGAISRHIRDLEEHLGSQLFQRVNNNLLVPYKTREFGAVLTKAFDRIHRASQELLQAKRRTVLTVRSNTNFMMQWLIPHLPSFADARTGIDVRLAGGSQEVDFDWDDVDVAFRYGDGQWPGLHTDFLFSPELIPVCTPELAHRLELKQPQDILRATVYHSYIRQHEWAAWFKLVSDKPFSPVATILLEEPMIVDQCIRSGLGVGLRPRQFVKQELAAGRLVAPFEVPLLVSSANYLVFPPERLEMPKIALFRKWLLDAARANRTTNKSER